MGKDPQNVLRYATTQLAGSSYVSALNKNLTLPSSPELPPAPKDIGGYVSVKVSQAVYDQRVKLCECSLIGRIVLTKGESPWKHSELKIKLSGLWNLKSDWK